MLYICGNIYWYRKEMKVSYRCIYFASQVSVGVSINYVITSLNKKSMSKYYNYTYTSPKMMQIYIIELMSVYSDGATLRLIQTLK